MDQNPGLPPDKQDEKNSALCSGGKGKSECESFKRSEGAIQIGSCQSCGDEVKVPSLSSLRRRFHGLPGQFAKSPSTRGLLPWTHIARKSITRAAFSRSGPAIARSKVAASKGRRG